MQETEVKILEINKEDIIKKIESLGATKTFEGVVAAAYFDTPEKKLSRENKTLRLRKRGDVCELTLKEKISKVEAKIMKEYEVPVGSYEIMFSILESLGYKPYSYLTKHRTTYSLENVHFEIDTFPNLPSFLEIESTSIEILRTYVSKLGFPWECAKPWSGKDVLNHYKKQMM